MRLHALECGAQPRPHAGVPQGRLQRLLWEPLLCKARGRHGTGGGRAARLLEEITRDGGRRRRRCTHQVIRLPVRADQPDGPRPDPQPLGARPVAVREPEARAAAQQLVEDERLARARAAAHGDHADGRADRAQQARGVLAYLGQRRCMAGFMRMAGGTRFGALGCV